MKGKLATVVHLELKGVPEGKNHHYFSSKKAMYDSFAPLFGITYIHLVNHILKDLTYYETDLYIIRVSELQSTSSVRERKELKEK